MALVFRLRRATFFIGVFLLLALLTVSVSLLTHHAPSQGLSEVSQPTYQVKTANKLIALTFDDGPSTKYTPEILNILQKDHARATFFVLGSLAVKHPAVIEDLRAAGCEVASHGYTHSRLSALSAASVARQIRRTKDALLEITGVAPLFFRPPYGVYNKNVLIAAAKENEKVVLWSIDTRDWAGRSTAQMVRQIEKGARPGAIILFHDGGGNRSHTIQALSEVVPALEARGYRFVTIDQLVQAGTLIHTNGPA